MTQVCIKKSYEKLVVKLTKLTEGMASAGIRDLDGSIVIRSGTMLRDTTFSSMEDVTKLDYTMDWVESKRTNTHITHFIKIILMFLLILEEDYKREKVKITSGDELPPGIVQLAKVYVPKKRKVSVAKMAGRPRQQGCCC